MAGEARRRRLRALLDLAAARDLDPETVEPAFVHESAARESGVKSNERLEFLGDSVLGMIVARWVYERFPQDDEGTLSARKASLVNDPALAVTAGRLGFGELLLLGTGARKDGGAENISILADAFEAFVASLYLHAGADRARLFVERQHIESTGHSTELLLDAKTRLQHLAQERWSATPVYCDESAGTPQRPAFTSRVAVAGRELGRGEGSSKKAAQQRAAQEALISLQASTS